MTSTTKGTRWMRRRNTCSPLRQRMPRALAASIKARDAVCGAVVGVYSGELQAPQFDPVCTHLGQIMMRLLCEPAFSAAAENLGQPHSHNWRNSALAVDQL